MIMKSLPAKKGSAPDEFTAFRHLQRILLKLLRRTTTRRRRRKRSRMNRMNTHNRFYEASITVMPKPGKNATIKKRAKEHVIKMSSSRHEILFFELSTRALQETTKTRNVLLWLFVALKRWNTPRTSDTGFRGS